jgi:hypothetical protein
MRIDKIFLSSLTAGIVLCSAAYSHSFYPWECCSSVDCYPIPVPREEVQATPQGWYLLKDKKTIPYESTRPSPDGRFHICRDELGKGKLIIDPKNVPCLWAPEGAS